MRTTHVPPGRGQDHSGQGLDLPELAPPRWSRHSGTVAGASWLRIARRMPALVGQAAVLAWRSGPREVVTTVLFNLGSGAATAWALVATTAVLAELFAEVPTPERVTTALPALALLALALVARGGCGALAGRAQARLEPKVVLAAEQRLLRDAASVELRAFDDSEFHDHLFRSRTRGCDEAGILVRQTTDLLTGLVGIVAAAGVLSTLHPALVPLLLLAMVPQWWGAAASARMRYRMVLAFTEGSRRKHMLEQLLTARESAAEVRSFTMERRLLAEFDRVARRELDIHLGLATRQSVVRLAGAAAGGLVTAGVFAVLAVLLARGVVPIAVAGAAVVAVRVAQGALGNALHAMTRVYESGLYFSDFVAFQREARARLPRPGLAPAPSGFERIELRDVTFGYPSGEGPSLTDVNLTLRRGRTVALVGENGSGKSTLAKLLSGLYTPQRGSVLWDGTDLAGVDGVSLRERISVIAQDHTHWPLTARGNTVMSSAECPERFARATAAAQADSVVAEFRNGWETLLDKRFAHGVEPSGGQWQRLAAARSFYRGDDGDEVPLLIADEPTAAMDARAEHGFFTSVHSHARRTGATVVLITHRLASVRMADHIVVLDGGRVAAQGSHAELMAGNGLYRELWELQASAYRAPSVPKPRTP
ncbi:multidrug ABC transporter permease [Nocardiopsis terrae]|uniref:ATP-binding cassette subfamily B protein/ATP-binding cassette subfamily C protein n=1 Tax=Nocardiopsis terrae TaxID=372655 RepID=A0ABR9HNV3_9ACTN|nr:ABC transporter ATP-binding protein [Nocardiopsis terrae]MBE1460679.1 ATP-binding cassette subfamily B protein/ATP-binding cassette subfamily C protein [Nocardiopsis terrae]GHC72842.1 multidrug ABC transporter permease [Nocardiopsis terrae]